MTMPTFLTHPVVRFLARRLAYSLVVLLGVLVVVFALVHLVPGDPVRIALGTRYTPEAYQALRSASGLDRPMIAQFFGYAGSALTRRSRRQLPQRRPGGRHSPRPTARDRIAGARRHRDRAADRATRRHLVGPARGQDQRRNRPGDKPTRRLGARLLDGHPADRVVLHDAGLAADLRVPTTAQRPGRLAAAPHPARPHRRPGGRRDPDALHPLGRTRRRRNGLRPHRALQGALPARW